VSIKDKEYYIGWKPWRLIDMFVWRAGYGVRYCHVVVFRAASMSLNSWQKRLRTKLNRYQ
jgi:beta-glucosidase/6-phospho-beta-glucosidase/beta-galactosidase